MFGNASVIAALKLAKAVSVTSLISAAQQLTSRLGRLSDRPHFAEVYYTLDRCPFFTALNLGLALSPSQRQPRCRQKAQGTIARRTGIYSGPSDCCPTLGRRRRTRCVSTASATIVMACNLEIRPKLLA